MGVRGPNAKPARRLVKRRAFRLPKTFAPGATRAERLIAWISALPVTSGILAGSRFVVQDWQRQILESIYADDSEVRTALLTMPRKNGKTGLAAVLALAHLCGPESESMGEVYSAAADRAQAALIFRAMSAVIDHCPELQERLIVRSFDRSIEDTVTGSRYQALSADVATKHGLSASFVVYDELAQAASRELFDVLETSMGARENPLLIIISTQSPNPAHVMQEQVAYGRQIRDGVLADNTYHASIFEAAPDADIWDEATWAACNPALGTFRSLTEMRVSARRAQRIPARRNAFVSLYLNRPVAPDTSFLPVDMWTRLAADTFAPPLGAVCYAGLDLASVSDLNALALYFPETGHLHFEVWAAAAMVDSKEAAPYGQWAEMGMLNIAGERSVDKRAIAIRLGELQADYDIRRLAFDRWGIDELERALEDEGVYLEMDAFGQGYRDMSPAVDALESAIVERKILHAGNPLVTWTFSNLEVDTDPAGNRKFSKRKARDKIDTMVAAVIAIGAARRDWTPDYDFGGLVINLS